MMKWSPRERARIRLSCVQIRSTLCVCACVCVCSMSVYVCARACEWYEPIIDINTGCLFLRTVIWFSFDVSFSLYLNHSLIQQFSHLCCSQEKKEEKNHFIFCCNCLRNHTNFFLAWYTRTVGVVRTKLGRVMSSTLLYHYDNVINQLTHRIVVCTQRDLFVAVVVVAVLFCFFFLLL